MQIFQQPVPSRVRFQPLAVEQCINRPAVKLITRSALAYRPISHCGMSSSTFRHDLASRIPYRGRKNDRDSLVVATAADAAASYASALAGLANSKNVLEAVNNDVETLSMLLKKQGLYDFFTNPVIIDERKKAILKTLADDVTFHAYTLHFLYLLVERKRFDIIKDIIKDFEKVYNNITDTQVAIVTSAVAMDSSQLTLIAKKIQSMSGSKNVKLQNVIDPTLIAGFMITFGKDGSRFIDLSVKGQLERIAAQLDYSEKVKVYQFL